MNVNWRNLIYGLVCALCLVYLALANARGYIPFVSSVRHGVGGTANHFHK
jgi:hypothetical protein